MARQFPNPHKVTEMSHEKLFDFKKIAGDNLRNFEMDADRKQSHVDKIRLISSTIKDNPNELYVISGANTVRCLLDETCLGRNGVPLKFQKCPISQPS